MRFFRLVFAALLSASIAVAAEDFTHEFRAMGTFFRLTFYETGARAGGEAARAAEAEVRAIERACNRFDPASELARLNAAAFRRPVTCSERLWELFSAADRHVRGSGGAFDPTVAPLMKLWGFHRKRRALPGAEEIAEAMAAVGWTRFVRLDAEARTVRYLRSGVGADFGGIAKGYALDRVKAVLHRHGIRRALLDFGGNIGCVSAPGDPPFRIGIMDPEAPDRYLAVQEMRGGCAATSGNYERYVSIGGKQYTHIMDPRTGEPVEGMLSVTVVTPCGTDSDALSTAVFVRGAEYAREICRKIPGTGVLIVRRTAGRREVTGYGTLASAADK